MIKSHEAMKWLMNNILEQVTITTFADIFKVSAGAFVSLLLLWLSRLYKYRSIKKALHVEIKDIQEKVHIILRIINSSELPDYNFYKGVSTINLLPKTPVILACYNKIHILPQSIIRDIIKINIILESINDTLRKKDEINFTKIEMLDGIIKETKPLFIQLNELTNKVLKVIEN